MARQSLIRAVIALLILAGSVFVVITEPVRLGLDLKGGTQITLQTSDSPTVKADAAATDRAVEVLRRRVNSLGVSESEVTRAGDTRIIVELPGVQDPQAAAEVIGRTAQLSFHPVVAVEAPEEEPSATPSASATNGAKKDAEAEAKPSASATPTPSPSVTAPSAAPTPKPDPKTGEIVLPAEDGERLRLGKAALTGEGVSDATAQVQSQGVGAWTVSIDFKGGGTKAWRELTGTAACSPDGSPQRRVAIALDNEVISSPQVATDVPCDVGITGGSTEITGNFTPKEAKDLALLIRGGALPVPVEIIEQRTVGATLGDAAIEASAQAAVIGIILTGLFLLVVYRLVGFLATIALACYTLVSYATLLVIGATLTLPGLAGFALAIGMAIDANVLVFERAKEEYDESPSKGLLSATTAGFKNAWSAIIDSNITTLLAAGLLFFLASGPVKGFGVTLGIGVLVSMFSALVITRVLVDFSMQRKVLKKRPQLTGIANLGRARTWLMAKNPDLMKHGRRWLALAGVAVIIALAGVGVRGLDFGVEFTGGRLIDYSVSEGISVDDARAAVTDAGFPRAVVQESGTNEISVRSQDISNQQEAEIRAQLEEASGGTVTKQSDELIGPSLGNELKKKAVLALTIALLAQLAYLAFRFRWTFGASSVLAMAHDVVILIGVFAWLGKPIDGVFLASVLTVIGYSVNDSVVVFDRVRERWTANSKGHFPQIVNTAILQTIPRTINTGLGALFILGALLVLGGDSLEDFALALLIGIIVGTYSSMFVAGPLAIELEEHSSIAPPEPKVKKVGTTGKRTDSGAVV
jgi:SecD/SecF fusion protein